MSRSQGHQGGFSLLETLIGLTLTALIAGTLMSAIQTGTRIWQASDRVDAQQETARRLQIAADWLEQAIPDLTMNFEPGTLFSGTEAAVNFTVSGAVGPNDNGFSRLGLKAAPSQACTGKTDLVLDWASVSAERGFPPLDSASRVLLACQDTVTIRYFGTSSVDHALGWKSAWKPAGTLPAIIAIGVTGPGGTAQIMARPQFAPPARQYERDA